jgi:hypothetical protein
VLSGNKLFMSHPLSQVFILGNDLRHLHSPPGFIRELLGNICVQ